MKNKKILFLYLISSLAFSEGIFGNFNINTNVSTSYDILKISESDFENAGLKNFVLDGGYSSSSIVTSLGVEASYPIKISDNTFKVGAGIDAIVENKIGTKIYSIIETEENKKIIELDNALNEARETYRLAKRDFDDIDYIYTVSNNLYVDNNAAITKLERSITTLENDIAKMKAVKSKNTLEKVNSDYAKYTQEADTASRREAELDTEIDNIIDRLKKVADTPENADLRKTLRKELTTKTFEKFDVHDRKVKALKNKNIAFNKLEVLQDYDKKLAKKEQEIEESKQNKIKAQENRDKYLAKREEVKEERNEKRATKDEAEENVATKEEEYNEEKAKVTSYEKEKNSVNIYNKINSKNRYGASIYALSEFEKDLSEDLKGFVSLRAGVKVTNNILYSVSQELQQEGMKVDNSDYIVPSTVYPITVSPIVNAGVGIKYRGLKAEVYGGYNKGLFGIRLGYEF